MEVIISIETNALGSVSGKVIRIPVENFPEGEPVVINGWLLPSADMTLWGVTLPVELLATAALLPIWLYRGRQGPHGPWLRWVWYGFYPAHLLVLWLIDTKPC